MTKYLLAFKTQYTFANTNQFDDSERDTQIFLTSQ